jgi:hypothetical protein
VSFSELRDVRLNSAACSSHFISLVYRRRGLELVKSALNPQGRVVYWSANRDDDFAASLKRVFSSVDCISAKAYPKAKRFTHTLFVADRQ